MNFTIDLACASVRRRRRRERPASSRGDVLVVLVAEVVLERDDRPDERGRLRFQRLPDELERVAQPLGRRSGAGAAWRGQPSRGRRRMPRRLVGSPDRRRHPVPHEARSVRRADQGGLARRLGERLVVDDELAEPLRARARRRGRPAAPRVPRARPRGAARGRRAAGRCDARHSRQHLDEDVEIADGPEPGPDLAQLAADSAAVSSRSKPSPKTRHAARIRRAATRIAWTSSGSSPAMTPGTRTSIRARWKRTILRPASAHGSSGRTPMSRPTERRSVATTAASEAAAAAVSERAAAPAAPVSAAAAATPALSLGRGAAAFSAASAAPPTPPSAATAAPSAPASVAEATAATAVAPASAVESSPDGGSDATSPGVAISITMRSPSLRWSSTRRTRHLWRWRRPARRPSGS